MQSSVPIGEVAGFPPADGPRPFAGEPSGGHSQRPGSGVAQRGTEVVRSPTGRRDEPAAGRGGDACRGRRGRPGRSVVEPAAAEPPPFANRGVETNVNRTYEVFGGEPFGVGLDWLTVTMSGQVARELVAESEVVYAGTGRKGFAKSERRGMMGGECWRRWEPVVPSSRWGLEYESWEWESGASAWPARYLAGRDCRPTRVDVAFDFIVPDDVLSDHVIEASRSFIEGKGLQIGISGAGGINTRYVGSVHSARRVRIYRKDLQDVAFALQFGPLLRVELTLRGDYVEDFWCVLCSSTDAALRRAAWHVREMMGLVVLPEAESPEPLACVSPGFDAAAKLSWVFRHSSAVLDAAFRSGVDVPGLVAAYMAQRASRTCQWRQSQLVKAIQAAGVEEVDGALRLLLGLR